MASANILHKNKYMIIVVPEGDPLDKTRDSEKYDPTWNYLKEIGIDVI